MSTDNLFPEEPKPKRKKSFQHQLLDYLRTGKIITEEIYQKEIGGKSVSAVIHNIRMRGGFEKGEFIVNEKVKDSEGFIIPGYRLVREAPVVVENIPEKEPEIAEEPLEGVWGVPDPEETPVSEQDTPEVSSIMVGVRGSQPELVIMFKGDFKPLRHVMSHMEVRYLLTNLMAFMPKPKE